MNPERIVQIYRRVLETPYVDQHSDFFDLGARTPCQVELVDA